MADEWNLIPDGPYWLLTGPECRAVFKRKEDAERDIQRMTAFRRAVVIHPTGKKEQLLRAFDDVKKDKKR